LLSLVLIGVIFFYFLPKFTSISAVWVAVRSMTWLEVATLVLAAVWNLATYCFVMVATMPGLTYRQAAVATQTTTAVSNTVPGGGAIGIALSYAMFSSWGFSRSRTSVSQVLAGLWNNFVKLARGAHIYYQAFVRKFRAGNNFVKLGMPVLALALLAFSGAPSGGRLIAGVAGVLGLVAAVVVFGLLLHSDRTSRGLGLWAGGIASRLLRVFHRPPVHGWELATTKFRNRTALLLHARWLWLTLATLVSHFSLFLVLLLSLRHVGVSEREVSWVEVLALFAFARLLTAIPFSPGGLGIVELTLITGLSAAGGDRAQVAVEDLQLVVVPAGCLEGEGDARVGGAESPVPSAVAGNDAQCVAREVRDAVALERPAWKSDRLLAPAGTRC